MEAQTLGLENPMSRVVIDEAECIGCESCVEICPEAFRLNEDAVSEFISQDGLEQCIQAAIDTCPTECLHWAIVSKLDETVPYEDAPDDGETDAESGLA